jgi:hypothetical protein
MKSAKHYNAPWGALLITVSLMLAALCLGLAVFLFSRGGAVSFWMGLLLLTLVIGCALFTIRGYTVVDGAVLVHRLFWATRLPLAGLCSVQVQPDAMRWSIRTFGNGGFFSFTGYYRNTKLGSYRAFVTDGHRTVVLHYSGRTVVLSPGSPEDFVRELSSQRTF